MSSVGLLFSNIFFTNCFASLKKTLFNNNAILRKKFSRTVFYSHSPKTQLYSTCLDFGAVPLNTILSLIRYIKQFPHGSKRLNNLYFLSLSPCSLILLDDILLRRCYLRSINVISLIYFYCFLYLSTSLLPSFTC